MRLIPNLPWISQAASVRSPNFGEKLFAAISSNQKILLVEKNFNGSWRPMYLSGFSELEDFLATILNLSECETNLTDFIKSHIFKLE